MPYSSLSTTNRWSSRRLTVPRSGADEVLVTSAQNSAPQGPGRGWMGEDLRASGSSTGARLNTRVSMYGLTVRVTGMK